MRAGADHTRVKDPGGEPLDRLIGLAMEMGTFLRLAIVISAALGRVHERGLVRKGHQTDQYPCQFRDRPGLADGLWYRLTSSARAADTRSARVHRGQARLHGAGTDRADESFSGFPKRPLLARRHALPTAHRQSSIYGFRSHGVGSLPYREEADSAK
jgi:hypothetical protein